MDVHPLTQLLARAAEGDSGAARSLATALYDELRVLARRQLAGERADHTLQPTALVHEAFLRLVGATEPRFESRAHFFGAAAEAIRRVLVDHARARGRVKRAKERAEVDLGALEAGAERPLAELIALSDALERLAVFAPTQARVVELRFFAGLEIAEVAAALDRSETSVQRDWRIARAWLQGELGGDDGR